MEPCTRIPTLATGADNGRLQEKATRLAEEEISFIPSNSFFEMDDDQLAADAEALRDVFEASGKDEAGSPEFSPRVNRMGEPDLLTRESEQTLFRQMNYIKFKARRLQRTINTDNPDVEAVAELESLLAEALAIRNHIVKANIRLVMAIAKKFVSPQHTFDDLVSDGVLTLMQTVEKFDYSRGFRFSTYAYRSIARNANRSVSRRRKEQSRFSSEAEEWVFEQDEDRPLSKLHDEVWFRVRDLADSMLNQLDRRERFIIRSRFALGAHRKVRSFQFLADKLGVSKERVRQLAHRAVDKLQKMASEYETDELFGAAMA